MITGRHGTYVPGSLFTRPADFCLQQHTHTHPITQARRNCLLWLTPRMREEPQHSRTDQLLRYLCQPKIHQEKRFTSEIDITPPHWGQIHETVRFGTSPLPHWSLRTNGRISSLQNVGMLVVTNGLQGTEPVPKRTVSLIRLLMSVTRKKSPIVALGPLLTEITVHIAVCPQAYNRHSSNPTHFCATSTTREITMHMDSQAAIRSYKAIESI